MSKENVFFSSDFNYSSMSDEKLTDLIRSGDKCALEYLINKYKSLVNAKVGKYYMVGAEKEDIMQEGLIGLFKAIKNFNSEKHNSFKTFANLCIERQLITAIKSSNRQKHMPLNSYVSLNKPVFEDDGERTLIETINHDTVSDPEMLFISKEELNRIEGKINEILSPLELEVLHFYLQGKSYQQIAGILNKEVKSIDNALQRVKKKIEKFLVESNYEKI